MRGERRERRLTLITGNEPSFATPFLYNYVPGYNWKAVNQSRSIVDTFYSDARNGYPGNIDSGAIPSWLIFNLIGLVSDAQRFHSSCPPRPLAAANIKSSIWHGK